MTDSEVSRLSLLISLVGIIVSFMSTSASNDEKKTERPSAE